MPVADGKKRNPDALAHTAKSVADAVAEATNTKKRYVMCIQRKIASKIYDFIPNEEDEMIHMDSLAAMKAQKEARNLVKMRGNLLVVRFGVLLRHILINSIVKKHCVAQVANSDKLCTGMNCLEIGQILIPIKFINMSTKRWVLINKQVEESAAIQVGEAAGEEAEASRPGSGRQRIKSTSPTLQMPSTIRFFSGNPSVETTEGIIHLYKDR